MSAADAIALVGRYLDSVNRRDAVAALGCLSEDIAHDLPDGTREIGADALRATLAQRASQTDAQMADIVVMASLDGAHAAAEYTLRQEHEASGRRAALRAGAFFAIDDGRISRISEHVQA